MKKSPQKMCTGLCLCAFRSNAYLYMRKEYYANYRIYHWWVSVSNYVSSKWRNAHAHSKTSNAYTDRVVSLASLCRCLSLSVDFIPSFAHFARTRQLNRYSFIVISSQQLQRSSQLTCAIWRINIEFLPFKSIEIH